MYEDRSERLPSSSIPPPPHVSSSVHYPPAAMPSENTYLLPSMNGYKQDRDEPAEWPVFKKALAEFFGTLLFVFIGCGTIQSVHDETGGSAALYLTIALAHGLAIFALVSATAKISGGHLNPAVSIAIFITDHKNFSWKHLVSYIVAQLAGAIAGAAILLGVYKRDILDATKFGSHHLGAGYTVGNGVLIEIILTLLLVLVILRTAVDRVGLDYAPLAIGIVVTIDHLIGIPVSGASMNPARSLGPAVLANAWDDHWIYWVGPISGALLASVVYFAFMRTL
eukprot:m.164486 g.164486  ORF g.164486 m.164486 type:complete len:281 (-) comp16409_c3_seq1:266-1108(-)